MAAASPNPFEYGRFKEAFVKLFPNGLNKKQERINYYEFFLEFFAYFDCLIDEQNNGEKIFNTPEVCNVLHSLNVVLKHPHIETLKKDDELRFDLLKYFYTENEDMCRELCRRFGVHVDMEFNKLIIHSNGDKTPSIKRTIESDSDEDIDTNSQHKIRATSNILVVDTQKQKLKCKNVANFLESDDLQTNNFDMIEVPETQGMSNDNVVCNNADTVNSNENAVNITENVVNITENVINNNETVGNSSENVVNSNDNIDANRPVNLTMYVQIHGNWQEMLRNIKDKINAEPDASLTGDLIKINVKDILHFRILQKYFDDTGSKIWTLDPTKERPRKFLFRGIPTSTPISDIYDFIHEQGFKPIKAAYLTNRRTKVPMPLWMVSVRPAPGVDELLHVQYFNMLKISVEDFKSSKHKQCYRCQRFGHSSLKCTLTVTCVRCAGEHWAKDCPLPRDENNATCANCRGDHPASYRGCPKNPYGKAKNKNPKAVGLKKPAEFTTDKTREPPLQSPFVPAPIPTGSRWNANSTVTANTNTNIPPTASQASRSENSAPPRAPAGQAPSTSSTPTACEMELVSVSKPKIPTKKAIPKKVTGATKNSKNKQKPKGKKTGKTSEPDASGFLELIKTFKELYEILQISDVLALLKDLIEILKSGNPLNNLYQIVETIAKHCVSLQCHG